MLDPGAELELPRAIAAWLVVEAGLIAIDDGVTRFRLDSGESHEMTGPGLTRIRNPESGRAVIWLASLKEPNSASAYEQDSSDLPPA